MKFSNSNSLRIAVIISSVEIAGHGWAKRTAMLSDQRLYTCDAAFDFSFTCVQWLWKAKEYHRLSGQENSFCDVVWQSKMLPTACHGTSSSRSLEAAKGCFGALFHHGSRFVSHLYHFVTWEDFLAPYCYWQPGNCAARVTVKIVNGSQWTTPRCSVSILWFYPVVLGAWCCTIWAGTCATERHDPFRNAPVCSSSWILPLAGCAKCLSGGAKERNSCVFCRLFVAEPGQSSWFMM